METLNEIKQMNTLDESAQKVEQPGQVIDQSRQTVIEKILFFCFLGIFVHVCGMFFGGVIYGFAQLGYSEMIYGSFTFYDPFMLPCFFSVVVFSGFLANFRFAMPRRFVREVIAWLLLLYVSFGVHYLSAYFFLGNGVAFATVVSAFCKWVFHFAGILTLACCVIFFVWLVSLFDGWVRKHNSAKIAKRRKTAKTLRIVSAVNDFIDRHPSRIVTGAKEYVCNLARYVIWGALLSLLICELMSTCFFSAYALALRKLADPAYESSFELDSFEGEKFGSVLPGDVVRKKLSEPIGAIDELMLQTDGNPAKRLVCIYGQKFLGNVSAEEANDLAEKTCAALQKLIGVELRNVRLGPRDGFRRFVFSDQLYARVKWDDHFFQKGKVLRLEVGLRNVDQWHDQLLKVDEVMGYKIGVPVGGDGTPKTPLWKFERIVNQCASNQISDGVYAVHDVSDLKREDAVKELEEARKAVEKLHGIKMFKTVDGDEVKQYDYYGDDVSLSVKLEYLREKQIRYAVLAKGDWQDQIHAMPPPGGHAQRSRGNDTLVFLLFMVVVAACIIWLLYRIHRKKKEAK